MDVEDARARCREFVKTRVLRVHARNALEREGFDKSTIDEVIAEYEQMAADHRRHKRRVTRTWATLLFLGCTAAFLYQAFFASPDRHTFHLWLLPPAMFGLLKMLLP